MLRNDCLDTLARFTSDADLAVTNLGPTGYEWAAARPSDGNLYSMGMGLVAPVAYGLALSLPHRRILALDGDGSLLLSLGILSTIATGPAVRLKLIVFDNEGYVSTGPQLSATAHGTSLEEIARGSGFSWACTVTDISSFESAVEELMSLDGPGVVVAKVSGEFSAAKAPAVSGRENTIRFVRHVEETENVTILQRQGSPTSSEVPHTSQVEQDDVNVVLEAGLADAGIDFVASLPSKELSLLQERLATDPAIIHVAVANEGEGAAICAGAWLAGKKPALVVASNGIFVATYAILRCHVTFGIPLFIVSTYRGDFGDPAWYAAHIGPALEPLLNSIGARSLIARDLSELRRAPVMMNATLEAAQGVSALIVGSHLTTGHRTPRART